jgi:quinol monooxygenase YgiN
MILGNMQTSYLTVIAELSAKPGSEEELRSLLLSVIDDVRAEAGCIQYDLHVSTTDPASFVFYENWKDADALKSHAGAPHMKAFGARAGELLAGPARILTYTRIA